MYQKRAYKQEESGRKRYVSTRAHKEDGMQKRAHVKHEGTSDKETKWYVEHNGYEGYAI